MMNNINERIEKLKKETIDLRKNVHDLKETIIQRNDLIINLLTKRLGLQIGRTKSGCSNQLLVQGKGSQYARRFPLQNFKEMKQMERDINEGNEKEIVGILRNLLAPNGLCKDIGKVIAIDVIIGSNVDGQHNKTRLLNYPKLINVLFLACYKEGYTINQFLDYLRRALKMAKNRYHKNNCRLRKKLRESEEAMLQEPAKLEAFF